MTAPKPNAELAYKVLDHIDAHPGQHNQAVWWHNSECGTSGCFAGWAVVLSGGKLVQRGDMTFAVYVESGLDGLNGAHVSMAAADLLGLDVEGMSRYDTEDLELFSEGNTREQLGEMVEQIFGPRPDGGAS